MMSLTTAILAITLKSLSNKFRSWMEKRKMALSIYNCGIK